MKPLVNLYR